MLCFSRLCLLTYSNAFACMNDCPLSSSAPRAQMCPSFTTGSKRLGFPQVEWFCGHYVVVSVNQDGFAFGSMIFSA